MALPAVSAPLRAPATSTASIKILRFNAESDAEPTYRTYQVEVEPTDRVLDALNMIKWYQDGTLTYRRSCAHGICGSDAMRINGVNRLACKVLMRDVGKEVVVEPLMGFRVIKDLVVDMEPFFAQYRSIFPYLINDTRPPERERVQSVEDREIFDQCTGRFRIRQVYALARESEFAIAIDFGPLPPHAADVEIIGRERI